MWRAAIIVQQQRQVQIQIGAAAQPCVGPPRARVTDVVGKIALRVVAALGVDDQPLEPQEGPVHFWIRQHRVTPGGVQSEADQRKAAGTK